MVYKVLLDTNFLLIPSQFGVDIFEGIRAKLDVAYELEVLRQTVDELEKLRQEGNAHAKVALSLLEAKKIKIISYAPKSYADDALAELGKDEKVYVATQDKGLKRRVKKKIFVRQKKYIEVVE